MNEKPVPVKEGDELKVYIENIASKRDGVAKVSGFVIFVKDVIIGQSYDIRIYKVLDSYAFGEVLSR
jgi:predicted RNA-binding protein with TRAM domain